MRTIVFRVLAGLLALAFGLVLAFGDLPDPSWRKSFAVAVLGIGFGLYALLGTDSGERLVWRAFGGRAGCVGPVPEELPNGLRLVAERDGVRFEIVEDRGDVGFYALRHCSGRCTHDFLQDGLARVKSCAEDEWDVPASAWRPPVAGERSWRR